MKVYLLLCEGFEEVEAIQTADLLMRAGVTVELVSPYGEKCVKGSHGICVTVNRLFESVDRFEESLGDGDAVVLPGGKLGTDNLCASLGVLEMVNWYNKAGKLVAAVCAAPTVLGKAGVLDGRKATCYPGFEKNLGRGIYVGGAAVTDGNVITGQSMGCTIEFGLAIVEKLCGREVAARVESGIVRP